MPLFYISAGHIAIKTQLKNVATATTQDLFVHFSPTAAELSNKKVEMFPYVAVIGKAEVPSIEQVLVVFAATKYICKNPLDAIELCFKAYWLFDIKYPRETHNVWIFIERDYFKNLPPVKSKQSPAVTRLLGILKNVFSIILLFILYISKYHFISYMIVIKL